MSQLQFQVLAIKNIVPDPNQPRKFYDEVAMEELTNSVKESGVLQPILVREQPDRHDHYLIVCGERRYRASKAAGLKTIPAVIRELSDEEALQLQIVENLQRKDVHPMEEAIGFKSFVDGKSWSFEEIAKRVGKSEYYVKQRLKLCSLTDNFQKLFFHNKMNISVALELAKLEASTQEEMYNDLVDDSDINDPDFVLDLPSYTLNKYRGKLMYARFDLSDKDLFPSMGACDTCQFNSSVLKLFPTDDKTAICGSISCFKEKTERSYRKNLDLAVSDPSIVLVVTDQNPDKDAKKIMADYEGVLDRSSFTEEEEPEIPDRSYYNGDNETPEEDEADYQKDLARYYEDLQEWKEKIATGAFLKAFIIAGTNKGKYTYVRLTKKGGKTAALVGQGQETEHSGELNNPRSATIAIAEIDDELERIKTKEVRAKQLDENNIWDEVKKHFNPRANASVLNGPLLSLERKAIATAMYNKLNYHSKDDFRKLFKIDGRKEVFPDIDETTFNQMCRYFMLDTLPPSICYSGFTGDAKLSLEIAKDYFPGVLLEIQDIANLKTEKRLARIDKRIQELQSQKKSIKASMPKKAKGNK